MSSGPVDIHKVKHSQSHLLAAIAILKTTDWKLIDNNKHIKDLEGKKC